MTTTYDFVAIGGGNSGLTAAGRIAAAGRRVALVDRGPVGGLCSLNGCNPKKVLVRSTEVLDEIRRAARFGIDVGPPRIDWSRVIDRKDSFTSGVTDATERSLAEQGIDLLRGSPRFTGRNELEVSGRRIHAGGILVATGSTPRPLEFPGAELVRTTDDILALREVPRSLVVIGAGVVAFEFGQVFARLGAQVTVLAPQGRALAGHDPELVEHVLRVSAELGIRVRWDAPVRAVRRGGDRLSVDCEAGGTKETLPVDFVLNAAGRVPSIDGLDLGAADVATAPRGVLVNDYLRSPSNPGVFAAGDAHGRLQLSPIASYEGRVVARNFLEGDVERVEYGAVPKVLFTVPQLAAVGVTEPEAQKRGLRVEVARHDMSGWKVYAIDGEPVAYAKVITEPGTGRILGAHLLAPNAGELILPYALAIRFGITADELRGVVYGYPTLTSALPYTLR